MTITKEDFEGLRLGLATIRGSPSLRTRLTVEDMGALDRAIEEGHLTLPYPRARDSLYVIMLWEVWCAVEKKPAFWVLKGEEGGGGGEEEEEYDLLGINVLTTGKTLSLRGWTHLQAESDRLGLHQRKNQRAVPGIRVYKGKLPLYWKESLSALVENNLWGQERDRLLYQIHWSTWGLNWKMYQDDRDIPSKSAGLLLLRRTGRH